MDGPDKLRLLERAVTASTNSISITVPRVLLSDGTEPEATSRTAGAAGGVLAGTPASGGTVSGPARVVLDPTGAHLEPGEVLVTPSTDPGWTPLFLTAGGLVVEMGERCPTGRSSLASTASRPSSAFPRPRNASPRGKRSPSTGPRGL